MRNLSNNNFNSTLEVITYWTHLTSFDSSNNHFTGVIPDISKLISLQNFFVQKNKLHGNTPGLPDSLSTCNLTSNADLCRSFIPTNDACGYRNMTLCKTFAEIFVTTSKAPLPTSLTRHEVQIFTNSSYESAIETYKTGTNSSVQTAETTAQNTGLPVFAIVLVAAVSASIAVGTIFWYLIQKRRPRRQSQKMKAQNQPESILKRINQDLELIKELNSGGFGVVYQGIFKGKVVAVKQILVTNNTLSKSKTLKMLVNETDTMLAMKHERIVELIDIDIGSISLIIEFMDMGSLQSFISKNRKIDWLDRYQIMLDVTEGMAFLHANTNADGTPKKRVFHQDLKSGNILLKMSDGKLRGKIGDFGLASKL